MFSIEFKDKKSRARLGKMSLAHGVVETPVFMPVGTKAAVKTLSSEDLEGIGAQIILSNTYHLNHRPGLEVIEKHSGLHGFMRWKRPILTDSGGFQGFSLSKNAKISDEGVKFRYPQTGEESFFTPENVIDIQKKLGSDIVMVLDQPAPYPVERQEAIDSLERTTKWALISRKQSLEDGQKMFGIVQGATFKDLRKRSAEELIEMDFDGYAIGGLSVGEPRDVFFEVLDYSSEFLPVEKPRYLMGVGDPLGIVKAIAAGVDMFDSVLPTRIARNGSVFSSEGRLNMKNSKYKMDTGPLDSECKCHVCSDYSRAYLRHLYISGEILAHRLFSWHNLHYLTDLVNRAKFLLKRGKLIELEKELELIYG